MWEYRIRAYYPPNRGGGLASNTDVDGFNEISVFKARMARGELSHIEVIAHVEPFGVTIVTSEFPTDK